MKRFRVYEVDENINLSGNNIVEVKVSAKADKLASKCRKLKEQYKSTLSALMKELNKDNPEVDFSKFMQDDFGYFTGELIS